MAATTDRRLVVNADDLGFTPGVNRGILEGHDAGVVTSASVLVNLPGFDDAARLAARTPTLPLGLHLNLVQGAPLSDVPSLTDAATGEFHSLGTLAVRALTRRVDPRDVRTETAAQIARLREAGVAITHLDGHRHAHALPGIWEHVVDVALRSGIDVIRWPRESLRIRPLAAVATAKKVAIRMALAVLRRDGIRSADHFVGLSIQGGTAGPAALVTVLDRLPRGTTELMVHPGHADPELGAFDDYTAERERELAVLLSPSVRERLRRGDLELIHFGRL